MLMETLRGERTSCMAVAAVMALGAWSPPSVRCRSKGASREVMAPSCVALQPPALGRLRMCQTQLSEETHLIRQVTSLLR